MKRTYQLTSEDNFSKTSVSATSFRNQSETKVLESATSSVKLSESQNSGSTTSFEKQSEAKSSGSTTSVEKQSESKISASGKRRKHPTKYYSSDSSISKSYSKQKPAPKQGYSGHAYLLLDVFYRK